MRTQVNKPMAEYRVAKRYHKLYTHLVDLIEGVEEMLPKGMMLDDIVELTQLEGEIKIAYRARPVSIHIRNGKQAFVLQILESKDLKPLVTKKKSRQPATPPEQPIEESVEQHAEEQANIEQDTMYDGAYRYDQ